MAFRQAPAPALALAPALAPALALTIRQARIRQQYTWFEALILVLL